MEIRQSRTYQMFKEFDRKTIQTSQKNEIPLTIETRWLCLDMMFYALDQKNAFRSRMLYKYAKDALDLYKQDISWG